jgi:glyoxylate utilization-related uncharacterized protein
MPETLHLTEHESIAVQRVAPGGLEVEATYGPGGSPPPKHLHPGQDERFEVLEGEIDVILDGEERTIRAGDTLTVPAGTRHRMWATAPARQRWETTPALRTERFFETMWGLQQDGKLERDPELAKLQMALTMSHFADEIRVESPSAAELEAGAAEARARGLKPEYRP